MRNRWILTACIGLATLAVGCNPPAASPGSAQSVSSAPAPAVARPPTPVPAAPAAAENEVIYHLNRAQVNLPRVKLDIGPHQIESELCTTVTQIATGLMFRESLGTNDTMFFVFGIGQQRSFYMRNVKFPIAAGYIDSDGILREIVQLKAQDVTPVPSKSDKIQYVLETVPDWFERNHVAPGALVSTPAGDLRSTLARRAQLP